MIEELHLEEYDLMDLHYLIKGLAIGFSVAAPVGPIAILCINRTLTKGKLHGFVSGLGAATADALYGLVAAFGLTFITSFLLSQKIWLQLIGGLFLCYLGIQTFHSRPAEKAAVAQKSTQLFESFFSILILTVTNPMTILFFIGIFSGIGLSNESFSLPSALQMVVGVFIGSGLWWLSLSLGVGIFKSAFTPQGLSWINKLSGCIIGGFGLWSLFQLIL